MESFENAQNAVNSPQIFLLAKRMSRRCMTMYLCPVGDCTETEFDNLGDSNLQLDEWRRIPLLHLCDWNLYWF